VLILKKSILSVLIIFCLFFSLKVQSEENSDNTNETEMNTQRTILMEMFTATWCGMCPDGSRILEEILSTPWNVIAIVYHWGDEMSTPEGNRIVQILDPGFPSAAIDRTYHKHKRTKERTLFSGRYEWKERCKERLKVPSPVSIALDCSYDPSQRKGTLKATICTYDELSPDSRVSVVLCENNLLYKQAGVRTFPYFHHHVVRDMITGPFGELLSDNPVEKGICLLKEYNFTLEPEWKPDDCYVVVFLHEGKEGEFKEIYQAAKISL